MYRFADLEAALMDIQAIPPAMGTAFRARLKYFQKIGIGKTNPGKGKRITYELDDVYLWTLCLEFAQFGIDPTVIKLVRTDLWPKIAYLFTRDKHDDDYMLACWPYMLTSASFHTDMSGAGKILPLFGIGPSAKVWVQRRSEIAALLDDRALIINITMLSKRIHQTLDRLHKKGVISVNP